MSELCWIESREASGWQIKGEAHIVCLLGKVSGRDVCKISRLVDPTLTGQQQTQ